MEHDSVAEAFEARPLPSSDVAFGHVVEKLAADAGSPVMLLERLRALYPKATLAERGLEDEPRVFYVYRDGRFEVSGSDEWWLADDVARVTISCATGRLLTVNDRWSQLMDAPGDLLVGRHYSEFVLPDAMPSVVVMFAALVAHGEALSEALLRRPDGSSVGIEFFGKRAGDVIEVAYRPARP
jgi:hypothetical protein